MLLSVKRGPALVVQLQAGPCTSGSALLGLHSAHPHQTQSNASWQQPSGSGLMSVIGISLCRRHSSPTVEPNAWPLYLLIPKISLLKY